MFYIRELYADKNISINEAYKLFCSKYKNVSINTFKCIWSGRNYKEIHYDVYTEENRKMNIKLSYEKRSPIKYSKNVNLTDVLEIRKLRKEGVKRNIVFSKYHYSTSTFDGIWYYNTFKNIIP